MNFLKIRSRTIKQYALFIILLLGLLPGCRSKKDSTNDRIEQVILKSSKTIVSIDDTVFVNPTILNYDGKSHLFVYDSGKHQILKLDNKGHVLTKFGRKGRGPGEFLRVNNLFLSNSNLYVVDPTQFRISRFNLDGKLNDTFNYGKGHSHALPPPAPLSLEPRAKNINNQPFVTPNGKVLLSNIQPDHNGDAIYKVVNWNGNTITTLGSVPPGSHFTLDYDRYQEAVHNQKIPGFYKPHVFPVSDGASSGEFYFIYSAFPEIAKYSISGHKEWQTKVLSTEMLDSIKTHFFNVSGKLHGKSRIALSYYVSGNSDRKGNLYLSLPKNWGTSHSLWIHKFDPSGNLVKRYQLSSKDVSLASVFDIDFKGRRIFVVTKNGEIRAYSY